MKLQYINAPDTHNSKTGYSQAVDILQSNRTLYVSGQIPVRKNGSTPESFIEQAEQVWANIEAQLKAAGMDLNNIVKLTTFLSDRRYKTQNSDIRRKFLGDLEPALTVIITGIFDESWLLEIEAIAVA